MMDERKWVAERSQAHRPHLREVAYRILGSITEADDAVQGAWLPLSRSRTDISSVHHLGGWLTTLVAARASATPVRKAGPPGPAGV